MDTWERLVLNSSLPISGFDAYSHLNAQVGGGSTIITEAIYTLKYIGEKSEVINYLPTTKTSIIYKSVNKIALVYKNTPAVSISYVKNPRIKVTIQCL